MIRLKQLREEAGLMQKEVSSALHIERSLYGKYENGRSEPPYDVLITIADYFNVTLDYLLGRTDEKSPTPEGAGLSEVDMEFVNLAKQVPPEKQSLLRALLQAVLSEDE